MAIDHQGKFMSLFHMITIGKSLRQSALLGRCMALAAALGGLAGVAGAAQDSVTYFDGATQRTVTQDPQWVAYFSSPASATTSVSRAAADGVTPFVTLHRTSDIQPRTATTGRASPVYREGDSPAGRLMALPGGVLVQFKPDWTDSQVREWALGKGLGLGQKLNIRGQWWVVNSEAGAASLELANALHASGSVLSASPNWWKQTMTR